MTAREFVLSMAVTLGGHLLGDKLFEYPEPKPVKTIAQAPG
jgi:hypothetical protein